MLYTIQAIKTRATIIRTILTQIIMLAMEME